MPVFYHFIFYSNSNAFNLTVIYCQNKLWYRLCKFTVKYWRLQLPLFYFKFTGIFLRQVFKLQQLSFVLISCVGCGKRNRLITLCEAALRDTFLKLDCDTEIFWRCGQTFILHVFKWKDWPVCKVPYTLDGDLSFSVKTCLLLNKGQFCICFSPKHSWKQCCWIWI